MAKPALKLNGELVGIQGNWLIFDIGYKTAVLKEGEKYNIQIKDFRDERSLKQNREMWANIQEISEHTGNEPMDVYIAGLEAAHVVYDFLLILPEAYEKIKNAFRAVKDTHQTREIGGKKMMIVKVFMGSSEYYEDEMETLIDYFKLQKAQLGIVSEYNR